jgi:ABC-2 type transport system ATP-binding protein
MPAYIRIRNLTKRYGRSEAVSGIDLEIGAGVIGLLGPNGAGKTTLLRIVATSLAPTSGTIEILGNDPRDAAGRLAIRRALGYVPQEVGLYETFTVFDFPTTSQS